MSTFLILYILNHTLIPSTVLNIKEQNKNISKIALDNINPKICNELNYYYSNNHNKKRGIDECIYPIINKIVFESEEYKNPIIENIPLHQEYQFWLDKGHELCDKQKNLSIDQKDSCVKLFQGSMLNK